MIKKTMQKLNSARRGKKGFTVAELCIVLALVAILTTMFVSFIVLMARFTNDSEYKQEFMKDSAVLKREFCGWAERQSGETFSVSENGVLTVDGVQVVFSDGTLTLDGETSIEDLDTVSSVFFEENGSLIKCSVHGEDVATTFVIYLRTATIEGGANE